MANFALLGIDPLCLSIARAIAGSPDDALTVVADEASRQHGIGALFPQLQRVHRWEDLLQRDDVDAVIIAAKHAAQWQQWRRLAESGLHVLIAPGDGLPMLAHYELALVAESSGAVLFPLSPARVHPAVVQLIRWLAPAEQNGLRSLALDRRITAATPVTSGEPTLPQLYDDADLLRLIAGELVEVTALASSVPTAGLAKHQAVQTVNVQIATAGSVVATWTLLPGMDKRGTALRAVAAAGTAELRWNDWDQPAVLTIDADGENPVQHQFDPFDAGPPLLEAFHRSAGAADPSGDQARQEPSLDWLDATRAAEVVDAAQHSLRRRRTISLLSQQPTEEENFKGTMATAGCGVLVLACLLLVIEVIRVPWLGLLSYAIIAVMGVFLALQFLRLVFSTDKD